MIGLQHLRNQVLLVIWRSTVKRGLKTSRKFYLCATIAADDNDASNFSANYSDHHPTVLLSLGAYLAA
jgi:hypothetical protein